MKNPITLFIFTLTLLLPACGDSLTGVVDQQDALIKLRLLEGSPTLAQKMRGIWIIGGLYGNSIGTAIPQVDLYDPDTDTWFPSITSIPYPVSFASATSVNSNIYVIGGFRSDGTVAILAQEYNILSNTWTLKSTTGFTAKANVLGVVSDNKIYILGGSTGIASAAWGGTQNTQNYNPADDSWVSLLATTLPAVGTERFVLSYNGVIYHMGGRITNATTFSATHDGYTCSSNANTSTAETVLLNPPNQRTGIAGAVYQYINGTVRVFIAGGITALTGCTGNYILQSTTAITTQSAFQYISNPFTGAWANATALPQAIGFSSAVVKGGYLYVFGGIQSISSFSAKTYCISLDPLGAAWDQTKVDMPIARYGHSAVVINQ
ncbi:MAG: hypothetical protein A2W19_08115 [Spirochaetes bacterium RBG_16_49_21]|nr:MAG: hypothetical protein A2W19_08115 [Spirochaetes bacterium RBG_16_49_21]